MRHHGQGIDDRAEPGRPADAHGSGHARRVAALEFLSQMRDGRERKVARSLTASHARMGGEKNRDTANAAVEIGAKWHELRHLGISEPFIADPRGARTAAYRALGEFFGDRDPPPR